MGVTHIPSQDPCYKLNVDDACFVELVQTFKSLNRQTTLLYDAAGEHLHFNLALMRPFLVQIIFLARLRVLAAPSPWHACDKPRIIRTIGLSMGWYRLVLLDYFILIGRFANG